MAQGHRAGTDAPGVDLAARTHTEFLDQMLLRLVSSTDRVATLESIVELGVAFLADHCAVVLPATRGRVEWWRGSAGIPGVSKTRTTRQAAGAVPGFLDVLDGVTPYADLDAQGWDLPEDFGVPGAVLAVSLVANGAPIGALVLVRQVPHGAFDQVDLVHQFAGHAARALDAATRFGDQARTVDVLRSDLLPNPLPDVPGVGLSSMYRPAQQQAQVGGDFYDVHLREDGSATFVLGDVCGNGLEAAVHSGRVRKSLHTLLLVEQRPAQLLYLVNAALLAAGSKLFTTLVVGTVVPLESGLRITVACGGHPPPLVLRLGGLVEEVAARGGIVGVLPEVRFHSTTLTLRPGETLLMYSDGVTEARAGHDREDLFGDDRLRAALCTCVGLDVDGVVARVREATFSWLGSAEHDDVTLLALQAE
jgi:serine phosphatase RsbU (regulator of sigma subunit)